MKYSEIKNAIEKHDWKYPQRMYLDSLPFNPFSAKARAYINAQVSAPVEFSPNNGNQTQLYLIDESGSPEKNAENPIFQVGILQGDSITIESINKEVGKLRALWPDRSGGNGKFHHSKDPTQRRLLFEEYCLKRKKVSFLHYKINKKHGSFDKNRQEHKATIYFSTLLSAIHDTQFSHGHIKIIASNRPGTFSDVLIYELKRNARIQALIDMVKYPKAGCCFPIIELVREPADNYPALDLCDYLLPILSGEDHSYQYKYGGCSLFEAADDFQDFTVHETYYSNDLVVPEGRILRFLKRKMQTRIINDSIISRLKKARDLSGSIKRCANELELSKTKDDFLGTILEIALQIGPFIDTRYWHIGFTEEEYLNIKAVGAYFRLILDYGIAIKDAGPFDGKEQFFLLNWR